MKPVLFWSSKEGQEHILYWQLVITPGGHAHVFDLWRKLEKTHADTCKKEPSTFLPVKPSRVSIYPLEWSLSRIRWQGYLFPFVDFEFKNGPGSGVGCTASSFLMAISMHAVSSQLTYFSLICQIWTRVIQVFYGFLTQPSFEPLCSDLRCDLNPSGFYIMFTRIPTNGGSLHKSKIRNFLNYQNHLSSILCNLFTKYYNDKCNFIVTNLNG